MLGEVENVYFSNRYGPRLSIVVIYICRAIKWWVAVSVNLNRQSEVGVQSTDAVFRSNPQISTHVGDIDVQALRVDLSSQLDRFTNLGSGWSLIGIDDFTINIARFNPLMGSSHIKTPPFIKVKNAVINVVNKKDEECFRWAVLSALYPVQFREHPQRLSKYKQHKSSLNWDGLTFPVSLLQVRQFERNNVGLTINVYTYKPADDKDTAHNIIPVCITKHTQRAKHIDLLLLQDGEKSHYVWIEKMSRLIAFRS